MFELVDNCPNKAVVKVIGIGGGGGNAVEYMVKSGKIDVEAINANTDYLALTQSVASILQLGSKTTRGLGAGADPEIGKLSAEEDSNKIKDVLEGADILFITVGMGGGTGTGGAPIVAQIAKEMGILTVAIVTKPFPFEGRKRMQVAEQGIEILSKVVDSLIVIPNARLLTVLGKGVTLLEAFKAVNDVLLSAVQGIVELITKPGLINVDFADVRTVMSEMGLAMMGTGLARGDNRARKAAETAISSPLLDNISLHGAKGVLVNITGGASLSISEFEEVGEVIKNLTADDATVIVGTVIDNQMDDELRVTIVATGLEQNYANFNSSIGVNSANINTSTSTANLNQNLNQTEHPQQHRSKFNQTIYNNLNYLNNSDNQTHIESNMDYLDIPAFLRRQSE
ncbi:MAG: cell division protein FtsZ [Gammaproteobacteria bacterium]|jgi:cell division protein FtsZ